MQTAFDLWPTAYWGFWAYPFLAIPVFLRRRLIMDLARIGSDEQIRTLEDAQAAIRLLCHPGALDALAQTHPTGGDDGNA